MAKRGTPSNWKQGKNPLKPPYSKEYVEGANRKLQELMKKVEDNSSFKVATQALKPYKYKPRVHPPGVRELAEIKFKALCEKHKDKVANSSKFYLVILKGVALRLALGELGYAPRVGSKEMTQAAFRRRTAIKCIKARLRKATPPPDPTPCKVSSTNMDGV